MVCLLQPGRSTCYPLKTPHAVPPCVPVMLLFPHGNWSLLFHIWLSYPLRFISSTTFSRNHMSLSLKPYGIVSARISFNYKGQKTPKNSSLFLCPLKEVWRYAICTRWRSCMKLSGTHTTSIFLCWHLQHMLSTLVQDSYSSFRPKVHLSASRKKEETKKRGTKRWCQLSFKRVFWKLHVTLPLTFYWSRFSHLTMVGWRKVGKESLYSGHSHMLHNNLLVTDGPRI